MTLPTEAAARKAVPLATGVLDYFPDALAAVAECSKAGNDQHNPGQQLHWARAKSGDEADALLRHLMDRGTIDTDGIRHSAKVAWRALALLQKELEAAGAPLARGARVEAPTDPTLGGQPLPTECPPAFESVAELRAWYARQAAVPQTYNPVNQRDEE